MDASWNPYHWADSSGSLFESERTRAVSCMAWSSGSSTCGAGSGKSKQRNHFYSSVSCCTQTTRKRICLSFRRFRFHWSRRVRDPFFWQGTSNVVRHGVPADKQRNVSWWVWQQGSREPYERSPFSTCNGATGSWKNRSR